MEARNITEKCQKKIYFKMYSRKYILKCNLEKDQNIIFEKSVNTIFQKMEMKLLPIFGAVFLAAPTLALQQSDGSFIF